MIYFTPFKQQVVMLVGQGDVVNAMEVFDTCIGNVGIIEYRNVKVPAPIGTISYVKKKDMKGRNCVKLAFTNTKVIDKWIDDLYTLRTLLNERNGDKE